MSEAVSSDKAKPRLRIYSTLGPSVVVTPQTLQDARGAAPFVEFYIACIVMVLFVGHNEYVTAAQQLMSFTNAAASSLLALLLSWVSIFAFFTTLSVLCSKGWVRSFYMPFFSIPMVFLPFFVMRSYMGYMMPDFEDVPIITEKRIRDIGLILAFEYLWVRHVARLSILEAGSYRNTSSDDGKPAVSLVSSVSQQELTDLVDDDDGEDNASEASIDGPAADPSTTQGPRVIEAVGVEIPIDELLFVRSEQHHLRFFYKDSEFTCRGRLKDLCDQIPQEYGVQANRSTWVAFGAIIKVDDSTSETRIWFNNTQNVKVTTSHSMTFGIAYQAYLTQLQAGSTE